ncbi:MAG: DUF2961 domain-containing protein [bacterium]|nr:DUF2961 domain-containing protein [bacterium]
MCVRIARLVLLPIGLLAAGCAVQEAVSTQTLLGEMTDLAGLAEHPKPPFTCRQFSSYDRDSITPKDPETWFANRDVGQYLAVEESPDRTEYVMMDADGPGAIVRIWSANPKGTLRIYLDHSPTPALEVVMADLLDGKVNGIPRPIAGVRSRGWNCYLPIPYAEHCKVTSDEGGFYYHVNYRTYPPKTRVTTFHRDLLEKLASEIENAAAKLASPRHALQPPDPAQTDAERNAWLDLLPGRDHEIRAARDGGAIYDLAVRVEAADLDLALRQLLLTIEFDGSETVACPLGDFFGSTPGLSPYESLPTGMTEDGLIWSHWVMPFQQQAVVRVRNLGAQTVRISPSVGVGGYGWTDRSMHFYARWRTQYDVPTRPMQDWNYVVINGQGVFVGAAFAIANPVSKWWGEGDEKIYVDGERFPSHFGTGTEDYYGYAWCCNEPFAHAYHNQPRCDGPANYGHTAVNRWHVIDRIPFRRSFRFDMELWHWHEDCRVTPSVVTYWYARPGATSNVPAPEAGDLRLVKLPPYVAPRVPGALEGEELTILEHTGRAAPQYIEPCSNENHLWWREAGPGDKLTVEFHVEQAGRYQVLIRCVKAGDYGIARLYVNDQPAGEPIDFYNDGIAVTPEIALGEFDLQSGGSRLTAEIVGANETAITSYMFGLDYIRLEPRP